jgi:hypothetical protein
MAKVLRLKCVARVLELSRDCIGPLEEECVRYTPEMQYLRTLPSARFQSLADMYQLVKASQGKGLATAALVHQLDYFEDRYERARLFRQVRNCPGDWETHRITPEVDFPEDLDELITLLINPQRWVMGELFTQVDCRIHEKGPDVRRIELLRS